jgi:hypothetical protein
VDQALDDGTLVRDAPGQARLLQATDGLPNGHHARADLQGEVPDAEPRAGRQLTAHDRLVDGRENPVGEQGWSFEAGHDHATTLPEGTSILAKRCQGRGRMRWCETEPAWLRRRGVAYRTM